MKNQTALIGLTLASIIYYSLYFNYGFNVGDEGAALLIASRVLDGERLFVDIAAGYGPLWHYPLIFLFKLTGPDFILLRIYFFCIATITTLLSFIIVKRMTGRFPLALFIAITIMLVPGTIHKSYVPFLIISNMLLLTNITFNWSALSTRQIYLATVGATVSYFVRADIGACSLFLLFSIVTMHALIGSHRGSAKWVRLLKNLTFVSTGILATTSTVAILAFSEGFWGAFQEYTLSPLTHLTRVLDYVLSGSFFGPAADIPSNAGTTLSRVRFFSILATGSDKSFIILTFLPFASAIIITFSIALKIAYNDFRQSALELAVLLILAFSSFLQFFIFRPDVPHLSQFMPSYIVLIGVFWGRWIQPTQNSMSPLLKSSLVFEKCRFTIKTLIAIFLISHIALYSWYGINNIGTGSIAIKQEQVERFSAANNVNVLLAPQEAALYADIRNTVINGTHKGEYVLCFPYCAGINVITNRPTFARRLYVDDSLLIQSPDWQQQIVQEIRLQRPPMILISNWAINGTEISRFSNWAMDVMVYINSAYILSEIKYGYSFYILRG